MMNSKSTFNIRVVIYLISTMFIVITGSCKKEENKMKFAWVKDGNKFYYDYYTPTDTIKDFRNLLVGAQRFMEQDPRNANSYETMFRLVHRMVVKKGGLYGLACESCGILGCAGEFEYLYAPNVPALNQELLQYGCSTTADSYKNKIIEINKLVTVPKGTFNTYVMLLENGDKAYWNPDEGLIMYDRYDYDDSFIGSLRLSR